MQRVFFVFPHKALEEALQRQLFPETQPTFLFLTVQFWIIEKYLEGNARAAERIKHDVKQINEMLRKLC